MRVALVYILTALPRSVQLEFSDWLGSPCQHFAYSNSACSAIMRRRLEIRTRSPNSQPSPSEPPSDARLSSSLSLASSTVAPTLVGPSIRQLTHSALPLLLSAVNIGASHGAKTRLQVPRTQPAIIRSAVLSDFRNFRATTLYLVQHDVFISL
ncbi:hypothetical protein F5Y08DRAFT_283177 [Xylaria arbuscula]|nr:hypothetical protein F5Y08DRAFT_283177 [Xylaria arbuscula]